MNTKRANGTGSICKEKSGYFRAAISTPDGKRIVKRFKRQQDADAWITATRAEMLSGEFIAPSDVTVGDWVIEYLKVFCAPKVRTKTLDSYIQTAAHLESIANIPLQKLTAQQAQVFFNKLPAAMSTSGKSKIYRLLKAALTKAHNLDMIKKNVLVNVDPPRGKAQKEIEIFTQEEIAQLLSSIKKSPYYKRYLPIVALAIGTGARLGELLGLKWKCVKSDSVIINNSLQTVRGKQIDMPPKTKAGYRIITISQSLANMLFEMPRLMDTTDEDYVFRTRSGNAFSPRNIDRVWKSILKEASLPDRHFHALRHTHATYLLANNVPLLEVAKRLGHSQPAHTLTLYGHAIPSFDKAIPAKVDSIFFGTNLAVGTRLVQLKN